MHNLKISNRQVAAIVLVFLVVPIGFATKFYAGPGAGWVNNSLGGLFYEIFWCLFLFMLFHWIKPIIIALVVFIATCVLEFLQLWHVDILEFIRSNLIGRTIIGSSFSWSDFIYYTLGSVIGYIVLKWLNKK